MYIAVGQHAFIANSKQNETPLLNIGIKMYGGTSHLVRVLGQVNSNLVFVSAAHSLIVTSLEDIWRLQIHDFMTERIIPYYILVE